MYDPLVEGRLMAHTATSMLRGEQQLEVTRKPAMWLRLLGLCATFAISGLMHEVLLYLLVPASQYRSGWWFTFFFIQAPLLLAESIVLRKLRKANVTIPTIMAVPATTAIIMLTAWFFWYPPIEQHSDLAVRIVDSINVNITALMAAGKGVMQQWQLSDKGRDVLELARQMWPGLQAVAATAASA